MASNIPNSEDQQLMRKLIQQKIKEKIEKYGTISMSEEMKRHLLEEIKAEIISGKAVLKPQVKYKYEVIIIVKSIEPR